MEVTEGRYYLLFNPSHVSVKYLRCDALSRKVCFSWELKSLSPMLYFIGGGIFLTARHDRLSILEQGYTKGHSRQPKETDVPDNASTSFYHEERKGKTRKVHNDALVAFVYPLCTSW